MNADHPFALLGLAPELVNAVTDLVADWLAHPTYGFAVGVPLVPVDTGARRIQPSASYSVTCWLLIDTIAMIGSPAV